jgi:DHA2 family multidrug resistance protein
MGMLVTNDMKRFGSYLSENIYASNPLVQERIATLAGSLGSQTAQRDLVAETVLKLRVTTQAMVQSFENGFRWTALAMSLGLVLVLFLKRPAAGVQVEGAH